MTFSWKNVLDRRSHKCKGLNTAKGMFDLFEKQPEAIVERLRSGKRRDQIGVGAGGDQILQGIEDHFESFSFCPERWESTGIYAEEDMI